MSSSGLTCIQNILDISSKEKTFSYISAIYPGWDCSENIWCEAGIHTGVFQANYACIHARYTILHSPSIYWPVFGVWEETTEPRGNPEETQTQDPGAVSL